MARGWNLLALGLALAAAGCGEAASEKAVEVRPVRALVVDPKPFGDPRSAVGEIKPRYESDLGFRIAGKITQRTVDIGSLVKKGDVLAHLDDQDYRNKAASAETDIVAAQAVLIEAQAAEGRLRHLLGNGNTTRANYDVALKNLRSAEAKLESAKTALKLANDQVNYCTLRADFDGIVTATGAESGQVVNVGQMVARLARPDDKDAVFAIAESILASRPSDSARPEIIAQLLSNPEIAAEGQVREISPVADPVTRTFQVKVTLKDPPEQMRFGGSVVGRVKASTTPVVVLPGSALFDKAGQPAVWIVDPASGSVLLKPVTVGRYETDRVVIGAGLVKGDVVVTAGVNRLRENQKVRVAEGSTP
ncbi:MAG: efflux RND transporter periplasmic adaptor subunit [Hyphomicrobiaceae bacterium]